MRAAVLLPLAEQDLNEIWDYIATAADDVAAANRVIRRIEQGLRRLTDRPTLGHQRADVTNDTYRFSVVDPYVIAYRFDDDTVTVARVVHGRRDFTKLFPTSPAT